MYTSRANGLEKVIGSLINFGLLLLLAYGTHHYARPALLEVWQDGYGSVTTSAEAPELNLFVGLFRGDPVADQPEDTARCELNLFLRWITIPLAMILVMSAAGTASDILVRERRRRPG